MERRRIPWLSFWRIRLLGSSDVEGLDGDELWETVLNQSMKSVLGRREKINMHDSICRGKFGLDRLFKCVKHFVVKRRVNEGLFDGKLLSHLC
ncbi:hypothetical protein CPC08DRAFT_708692, partial [Agrocybe pediades]